MKRYLVFAYDEYYPGGGWNDFQQAFEIDSEAISFADSILSKFSGGVDVIDLQIMDDIYVYPKDRVISHAR